MKCLGAVLLLVVFLFASVDVQACGYGSTALVLGDPGHCGTNAAVLSGSAYGALTVQSYALPVQPLAFVQVRSVHHAPNVLVVQQRGVHVHATSTTVLIRR